MLLKIRNNTLTKDVLKTYLTAAASASDTSLTVKDNTGFRTNNQYIMLGEPGQEGTEVVQVNDATASEGTSITIDNEGSGGCVFAHPIGTPVYAISYNQIEFSHADTSTGTKSVLQAATAITPDNEYSQYEDTAQSDGYYFARFKNATSGSFSKYTDAIPYTGYTKKSLYNIIKKVRRLLDEGSDTDLNAEIKDSEIVEEINDKQRDIAHDRLWPFYENTKSLSSVEDQFKYSVASDVNELYFTIFDTQPLALVDKVRWANLHWDSDTSSTDPSHAGVWDNSLWLYPRPSTDATTTTLGAAISTTTATTITVADGSSFKRGDFYRFIIDSEVIYATAYDSDNTQFTGCLRGQEGTTAATHTSGTTATERNIVYHYQEEPTDLSDMTDETKIPEPILLAYGAAMELALKKEEQVLHDRLRAKYEGGYLRLRAKYDKKLDGVKLIKDQSEVVSDMGIWQDPNKFPQNLE